LFNTAHVVAKWAANAEDCWSFPEKESLNPVLFRSTELDSLNKEQVHLVFELVVYIHQQGKTTEMSCGWASIELEKCERDLNKVKLEIKGGSPMTETQIQGTDVHTKRQGVKGFIKLFNQNIKSSLTISLKSHTNLEADAKVHFEMMPSTCLVHKKLLHFVSGFRNYASEKLNKQSM
jgi:hypothetical protein